MLSASCAEHGRVACEARCMDGSWMVLCILSGSDGRWIRMSCTEAGLFGTSVQGFAGLFLIPGGLRCDFILENTEKFG